MILASRRSFGKPLTTNEVLAALEHMVNVHLRRSTRLIDLTVTHRVPELTDAIANSIVNEYVRSGTERQDSALGLISQGLGRQAEVLRAKLESSEQALQTYREQNQAASLDDQQNTVAAELGELSTKATEAKSIRIKLETDCAQAASLGTDTTALLNVPTVAHDPAVQALLLTLTKAEDDFAALGKRYKHKHPKYIEAATVITELKRHLSNTVMSAAQTLQGELRNARATESALNQAMLSQQDSALKLSKLSVPYTVLTREVESDRLLYDAVLRGTKETAVNEQMQQAGIVRVVEPAVTPDVPASPNPPVVLALSGLGGLILGLLGVLGARVTDTSITSVDEAEAALGLAVFSAVPQLRGARGGRYPLAVVDQAKSEGAEAFRTLRASLSTHCRKQESRVLLFTSALPNEGKTLCALNYAASLAQAGFKTLLVDADLRRPSVEAALTGSHGPGLSEFLLGQKKLAEVVQTAKTHNLYFAAAGATALNPAELLAKDGLRGFINEALEHYDRIVLDSAPISAVSDTLLLVKSVDTLCLVVRAAHTSARYVRRCIHLLQSADAPLAGVVLNRVRRRSAGYNAYHEYAYRYDPHRPALSAGGGVSAD